MECETPIEGEDKSAIKTDATVPQSRQNLLKWNGWGYKDSFFYRADDVAAFSGNRYPLSGHHLPGFFQWAKDVLNVDLSITVPKKEALREDEVPKPIINEDFMNNIKEAKIMHSLAPDDRVFRAHGHTVREIHTLRTSMFPRIPDIVLWPKNHDEVVKVVSLANRLNVVIIPFGGGTNVTGALECPEHEQRCIASLDTSQMNRILWIDEENLLCRCEAGIIGQDLERSLQKKGFTVGHEPDSIEFSSLGGWVATRASGMKKSIYGNIEDLLVHVTLVTSLGVIQRGYQVPRVSSGPDLHELIIGSEGLLGVITEVSLKIRPLPECQKHGSLVFPDFDSGVLCLREVARRRLKPASIRLMDNDQFKFGHALKVPGGYFGSFKETMQKLYLTKLKGFDLNKLSVATLLFEGTRKEVNDLEKEINEIAAKFNGIPAGEENGKRGYLLTFVIAYIRDFGMDYHNLAESFETSVPWSKVSSLCRNVKLCIQRECAARNIKYYYITCRVTQSYDAGACIYFYLSFNYASLTLTDPMAIYEELEAKARDEILRSGGSISHHHGVGKIRQKWMPHSVSPLGLTTLQAIKKHLDPKDIFACGNLIPPTHSKL